MQNNSVLLIGKQFFKKALFSKSFFVLLSLFIVVLAYVTIDGWMAYHEHHTSIEHHQKESRKSWENNPDKHPHRMAHFGSFVFRPQHPFTIFDSGLESYTGNSIYLEAHKQNTANFTNASLSTGLVRFGDLDIAMLLQLLLPLILFFIGYDVVSAEKESGTLKIIYMQGVGMKEILLGKSFGLFLVSALFFVPALTAMWSLTLIDSHIENASLVARASIITICYLIFYIILSCVIVIVSAKAGNSNKALLTLLGAWLLFFIIVPKTAQVVGNYMYPNLSKIEFKNVIDKEVAKQGDSHNPYDPYFNSLRDSLLKVHHVTRVEDLPFNYKGFLMSKGEEQTSELYASMHSKLINAYRKQNHIAEGLVIVNPYLAIKGLSMSLSAADFESYTNFLRKTEEHRYKQSQYMNGLQMKYISNDATGSSGKVHVVDRSHWKALPHYKFEYLSVKETLQTQIIALLSLLTSMLIALGIIIFPSNRFKII